MLLEHASKAGECKTCQEAREDLHGSFCIL